MSFFRVIEGNICFLVCLSVWSNLIDLILASITEFLFNVLSIMLDIDESPFPFCASLSFSLMCLSVLRGLDFEVFCVTPYCFCNCVANPYKMYSNLISNICYSPKVVLCKYSAPESESSLTASTSLSAQFQFLSYHSSTMSPHSASSASPFADHCS